MMNALVKEFEGSVAFYHLIVTFYNFSLESLRAYFGKFGEIADSVIMKDKNTNEPRYA